MEKKARTETFVVPKDDPRKKMRPPAPPKDPNSYKTMSGSLQYRFGVLARIVKHMKTRHQDGEDHPLTLEDILDETNQLDIGTSVRTVSEIKFFLKKKLYNNPYFSGSKQKLS